MEAVAHEGQHDVGVGTLAKQLGLLFSEAGQIGAKKDRMQGCNFEFEANRAVHRLGVHEVV